MSGDLVECEQHQFCYEPYDTCPVCDGVEAERERIIKLIEDNMDHWDGWLDVKELIKGEQK